MSFLSDPFSFNRGLLSPVGGGAFSTLGGFDPTFAASPDTLLDLTGGVGGFGLPLMVSESARVPVDIRAYRDVSNVGSSRFPNTLWVDVIEKPDSFTLIADIPGVRKQDVNLTVKDRLLIIQCRRYFAQPEQGTWRRHERDYGSFRRTLRLPGNVDTDSITASVEDGQLLVFIKKTQGEVGPKRIQISDTKAIQQEPQEAGMKQQPTLGLGGDQQLGVGEKSEQEQGGVKTQTGGFGGQQGIGQTGQQSGLKQPSVGESGLGKADLGQTSAVGQTGGPQPTGTSKRESISPTPSQPPIQPQGQQQTDVDKEKTRQVPVSGMSGPTGTGSKMF